MVLDHSINLALEHELGSDGAFRRVYDLYASSITIRLSARRVFNFDASLAFLTSTTISRRLLNAAHVSLHA